jgi:hypothetical protein
MDLKIQFLANNDEKTWTLKPTRDYRVGTASDDDIVLTGLWIPVSLRFSFDSASRGWNVVDLSGQGGILLNDRPLSSSSLQSFMKIELGVGAVINVILPEAAVVGVGRGTPSSQTKTNYSVGSETALKKLTWPEYVDRCVDLMRWANRFSLVTGYRFTPWVRATGSIGFNSFDGYIIPDFQTIPGCEKSYETIVSSVQKRLGEMPEYDKNGRGTDCCLVELTDAHIIDSINQSFLNSFFWVEFFPVKRGVKNHRIDYREFCVVSYNRVRTYLLIEDYGYDLFVSWITRYEPPSPEVMKYLSLLSTLIFILTSMIFSSANYNRGYNNAGIITNMFIATLPLTCWVSFYVVVPRVMMAMKILPKRANANFLWLLMLPLILIFYWVFIGLDQNMFYYNFAVLTGVFLVGWLIISILSFGLFIVSLFNPPSIPPLDLVDAKKLDDVISKQVELAIKPMLEKGNYTTEQISQILTKTSLGKIQFRR